MQVSGIGNPNPYTAAQATQFKQTRQDFTGLGNALASGDITSAQSAFATLLNDVQNSGSTSGPFGSNSQAGKDFQALQNALQSGDIKGAQVAYNSLKQDLGSVQGHAHHHHHKSPNTTQPVTPGVTTTPASPDGTSTQSAAASINTLM